MADYATALKLDAALLERVRASLPDDPTTDAQAQADTRLLLAFVVSVGLIAPQASQALQGAAEFVRAITDPFGDLAQGDQP